MLTKCLKQVKPLRLPDNNNDNTASVAMKNQKGIPASSKYWFEQLASVLFKYQWAFSYDGPFIFYDVSS